MEPYDLFILAFVTEALVEYLFSGLPILNPYMKYIAAITGVGIAILFQADLFLILGFTTAYPLVTQALTGIIFSRGSNLLNDIFSFVQEKKLAARQ